MLRITKFDPKPLIVFTTTMAGLVAGKEIFPKPSKVLVYLLHTEFREWKKEHLIDKFTFHIHHWSYFRKIEWKLLLRAKKAYPEINAEEYRIRTSGDLWGEQCKLQFNHFYRRRVFVLHQEHISVKFLRN